MAGGSNAQLVLAAVGRYNRAHPQAPIDPQAELAISEHEGLSGGIGDGGHAFGPNQLNNAGGVLTGRFAGLSPEAVNQWAWSPQGLDYALSGVGNAAGGLHGLPAIEAIATKFERPANPAAEIADAAHHYGLPAPTMASIETPGRGPMGPAAPAMPGAQQPQVPPGPSGQELQSARMLAAAIGNANQTVGLPTPAGLGNLLAKAAGARR
jgi:hypothetical protein